MDIEEEILQEQENLNRTYESEEGIQELLDGGQVSNEEAAFLRGYNDLE